MNNVDIIKSTYEGKNSEENGRNLALYADENISWTEAKGFPYGGTYIGLEEITRSVFSKFGSEWDNYKFTPENYQADGDQVVAYGTCSGTGNTTGRYFEARVTHLWKLHKRKIISFEQFVDSKTVADAYH
ncbi:nuclear transport factor 2 family protein [uncultured Chryseobacterium sp.]|uniref:nuclear transport factor 2 family protein n=1 Tax=uncultured Chryseobacterium sp. TaxID=259322 RepID=UPI0025EF3CF9|nr:nuclear transport factor 2 family protein [uncultured Chryseobacterium sp.]